jgi:uncharacterized protein
MYCPRPGFLRTCAAGLTVLALALSFQPVPRASESGVVISEFRVRGPNGAADEFVELHNGGTAAVNIGGWKINGSNASGSVSTRATIPADTILAPGCFYLVTNSSTSGGPYSGAVPGDLTYGTGIGDDGGIGLLTASNVVIDAVGMSTGSAYKEGTPLAPLSTTTAGNVNRSYERKPGGTAGHGTDTDNNVADFQAIEPSNPQNSASPCIDVGGPPPAPTLSIDDVTALEGDGGLTTFTFSVTLNAPAPAGGVVFDIATADGTATVADDDYVANSATGVTILGGQTTYAFDVSVVGDTVPEADETFTVNVTNISGATGAKTQGIGTILNDEEVEEPELPEFPVVISQVYGGGGNSGATYTHDFIELFNRGFTPVTITGWSVQYTSAAGTSWNVTTLSGTLQPGQYYLVQQAAGAGGTTPLPTPDATGTAAMSANNGKVALVSATTALVGACPVGTSIIDFVGFGSANCFEGGAATGTLANATAAIRKRDGCQDTDHNGNDFSVLAPTPRNTTTPAAPCGPIPVMLSIDDVTVAEGDAGTTPATFTVSLNIPSETDVTFDITTVDGTATVGDADYIANSLTAQIIPAGQPTYTFTVLVVGDLQAEPNEQFSVTLSNISGALAGRTTGTGTIVNDDFFLAAINQIQGAGFSTPYFGQGVTTTGIVTALKGNGFFMQTPDGLDDGDPETSEGLFVFTSTLPAVSIGDAVVVKGTATEFFDLTQIVGAGPGAVTVTSSGHPLPEAVQLTTTMLDPAAHPSQPQLERLEGMRVAAPALVAVAPTNNFAEIETVLGGVPRPMREPGIDITAPVPPDPITGVVDCCIPRWDRNPERFMVDTDGLAGASPIVVSSLATLSNVVGPLDFAFGRYKVLPEASLTVTPGITAAPVPAPAAHEFTVASYNIQNFTGNVTQRRKAALHIRTVMRAPDIIGLVEIGSLAALQSLAAQIDDDAMAVGEPAPGYQAYLIPFGTGTQHLGFLVKGTRVAVQSVTQELGDQFLEGTTAVLHDRPPLVLRATVDPHGANPGEVIVVVNHTRSFISADHVEGEGPRVRAKRTQQAESIAALLQDLQTTNPTTPVIAIGDYNAFQFSDGYTDPIAILKGLGTDTDTVVVQGSPDLVEPDFVNLTDTLPVDQQYTYMFEATPQALDHVLVNGVAFARFQRYAVARGNADFAGHSGAGLSNDPTRPEANSDHDSPVAYFALPGTLPRIHGFSITPTVLGPPDHRMVDVTLSYTVTDAVGSFSCVPSVTSNEATNAPGSGSTAIDWEVVTSQHVRLRAERAGRGGGRIYMVTLTCTDTAGNTSQASALATVPHDRR